MCHKELCLQCAQSTEGAWWKSCWEILFHFPNKKYSREHVYPFIKERTKAWEVQNFSKSLCHFLLGSPILESVFSALENAAFQCCVVTAIQIIAPNCVGWNSLTLLPPTKRWSPALLLMNLGWPVRTLSHRVTRNDTLPLLGQPLRNWQLLRWSIEALGCPTRNQTTLPERLWRGPEAS